ncbi:MAG: hypothetical protein Q4C74_07295 [Rothia sp. (in: high G+C Gram-positive bacteria)]|nr:hypothetical protein [Rothia sp. (in: high G+C Gram-positive bacteria)]
MNTKELSPAFLTSLLVIFIGALLISFNSSLTGWIGWVLILAGLALNVFSALLTIQGAKGGPLPQVMAKKTGRDEQPATEDTDNTATTIQSAVNSESIHRSHLSDS